MLLTLESLLCLLVHGWHDRWPLLARSTIWYLKRHATFFDGLALVRRPIWAEGNVVNSTSDPDALVISQRDWARLLDQLASTAGNGQSRVYHDGVVLM